jgi:hypothetical protein
MLPTILLALGAIVVILALVVAFQPAQFRITRSTTIAAPPSVPFALVNDFHKWPLWSPWEKQDPAMKRTYEGPAAGVGSVYSWIGNKQVGEGRMTLIESYPSELIRIQLEFLRPFKATNTAEFKFQPKIDQTLVTWSMLGHKNFMFKAMHMVMNMDKMVGGDFEKGLEQMKSVAESAKTSSGAAG